MACLTWYVDDVEVQLPLGGGGGGRGGGGAKICKSVWMQMSLSPKGE